MAGPAAPPPKPPIKFNGAYCCSYNLLIMKLLEVVCLVVTVVLASQFNGPHLIVYIQIVGALGTVTCITWILLYMLNINQRFPEFFPTLIMVFHFVMAVLTVGVCICCAYLAPQFKISLYPHYLVSTILSLVAAILFLVDAFLNLCWWRGAQNEINTMPCSPWEVEYDI